MTTESILEIVKFASLVCSSALGLLGVLKETKNNGRITRWGKYVVVGICISGSLAVVTQIKQSELETEQRQAAERRAVELTKMLVGITENGLNINKALTQSIDDLQRLKDSQKTIIGSQDSLLDQTFRLASPFHPVGLRLQFEWPLDAPDWREFIQTLDTSRNPGSIVYVCRRDRSSPTLIVEAICNNTITMMVGAPAESLPGAHRLFRKAGGCIFRRRSTSFAHPRYE